MIYNIALLIFIVDRFLKFLVSINLDIGEVIPVLSFFQITHLRNTGMAFGLFAGNNNILIIINILVVIALVLFVKFNCRAEKYIVLAYGLILGGAASNLWDRCFYGGVIDYIDFKIWPVFNIADTSITIAAFLIAYSIIKPASTSVKKKN